MTRTEIYYRKLPGKKRKFIGRDTAWMGPDHLLIVESSGISETYKRLYFKDIQAVSILKTPYAFIANSILFALMVILTASGLYLYSTEMYPVSIFMWIVAGVMFVYFISNAPQGASCECWLFTRVQKEKLRSVHTVRSLKKAMKLLIPAIEKSQGRLSKESLVSARRRLVGQPGGTPRYRPVSREKVMTRIWHQITFSAAIISGCIIGISIVYHPPLLLAAGGLTILGCFACAVIAISIQTAKQIHGVVKLCSWLTAAAMLLTLVIGYVENMFFYFRRLTEISSFQAYNQWEMMKFYAGIDPMENPLILGITIIEALVLFSLGVVGWYFLHLDQD